MFGTTPPVESFTVPEMLPPVSAIAKTAGKNSNPARRTRRTIRLPCFNQPTPRFAELLLHGCHPLAMIRLGRENARSVPKDAGRNGLYKPVPPSCRGVL